jgi:hypothetical protein
LSVVSVLAAAIALSASACADEDVAAPSDVAAAASSSPGDRLHELEWLLGEWTGATENAVVLVSAHWCEGGAFIEREVVVHSNGGGEVGGTQRIGWDPVKGQIKCWTFDSQGGTGEGYWRRDGNSWIVESQEVLADGRQSATTTAFAPLGEGRFVWEATNSKVGGESLPAQRIEFVRAPRN